MGTVRLTATEISDFQRTMRAVATNAGTTVCGQAALVANAYTQWAIRSGVAAADPNADADFDDAFFPPALDVIFSQAVTIFISGHCDSLTALERRQLEAACRWATGSGADWSFLGWGVGFLGLALAGWALLGKWGKRR